MNKLFFDHDVYSESSEKITADSLSAAFKLQFPCWRFFLKCFSPLGTRDGEKNVLASFRSCACLASLKLRIMDSMAMFTMTPLEALNLLLATYDFRLNEGAVVQVSDQVFDTVSSEGRRNESKHMNDAIETLDAAGIEAKQGATISRSNEPNAGATYNKQAFAIVLPCGMSNEEGERNNLLAVYFQMGAAGGVTRIFVAPFHKSYGRLIHGATEEVSERSERALLKTRAMNPSIWLQTATSTTKLTHSIRLARSFRSSFIKNGPRFARRRRLGRLRKLSIIARQPTTT